MLRSGSKCTFIHGETFAEPGANQDPDHDSEARLAVFRQLRRGARQLSDGPCETTAPACKTPDHVASRENSWLGEVIQSGEGSSATGSCSRLPFFVGLADLEAKPSALKLDDDWHSFASTRSLSSECSEASDGDCPIECYHYEPDSETRLA